jgi:hypothetical protein
LNWDQVQQWQINEQFLGRGLFKDVFVVVPFAPFKVEAVAVAARFWLFLDLSPFHSIFDVEFI